MGIAACILVMSNFIMNVAAIAIAHDSRQFTSGDFFRHGMPLSIILLAVLGVAMVTIWPMMGMPILVNP